MNTVKLLSEQKQITVFMLRRSQSLTVCRGRPGQLPAENKLAEEIFFICKVFIFNRVLFLKRTAGFRLCLTQRDSYLLLCLHCCKACFTPLNHQAVAQLQAVRKLQQSIFTRTREKEPYSLLLASSHTSFIHYFRITSKACQEPGLSYIPDFNMENKGL